MNFLNPSNIISSSCDDLATCFQAIYNLLFAILLALAFLYFLWGAFEYLLSGIRVASIESGKRKMINSIIAVIIALVIPVIINLINPEVFKGFLLEIPKPIVEFDIEDISGSLPGTDIAISDSKLPRLKEKSLDEIATKLKNMNNYSNPTKLNELLRNSNVFRGIDEKKLKILAAMVYLESKGDPNRLSTSDKCLDGNSFSIGLFQINMAVRDLRAIRGPDDPDCDCEKIFEFTGRKRGKCPLQKIKKHTYNCRVKNKNLYDQCVRLLQDLKNNAQMAYFISGGWNNLEPWTSYKILRKNKLISLNDLNELLTLFQFKKLNEN